MSLGARKLGLAIFLAMGFLGLSLLHAVIAGSSGGPTVLLSIPEVSLRGPFGQLTLFGEVSLEGVVSSFLAASPIVFSTLLFGLLSALLPPHRLLRLSYKFRFAKGFFRMLAIVLSWPESVLVSARGVKVAKRLRGENKGARVLLTLRAAAHRTKEIRLAFALQPKPIIPISETAITFDNVQIAGLEMGNINFDIAAGELVVLTGPTGSGKTTLLQASCGLASEFYGRQVAGEIKVFGLPVDKNVAELASLVSFVPQDPRGSFMSQKVADELFLATKHYLGTQDLLGLEISSLSDAEVVFVAITRALNPLPKALLLDEPFAALDPQASAQLVELIYDLVDKGVTVVLAEHRIREVSSLNPRYLKLESGLEEGAWSPKFVVAEPALMQLDQHRVLRVSFDRLGRGKKLLGETDFSVHQGEILAVSGANGAGKTSLLEAIFFGPVRRDIYGVRLEASARPDLIALVPQGLEGFFSARSLREELKRADQLAKVLPGFTEKTLRSILVTSELSPKLLSTNPRDLSFGTRLTLAIAMQLSHRPKVLLLDEPVRGFDPVMRANIAKVLRLVVQAGTAIIFTSQDSQFVSIAADRQLLFQAQVLVEQNRIG